MDTNKGYTKKSGLHKSDCLSTRTFSRSTGAFGTGIYFIKNVDDYFKKWSPDRQMYEIDLSKYKLLQGSMELHKWLNDAELVCAHWFLFDTPEHIMQSRMMFRTEKYPEDGCNYEWLKDARIMEKYSEVTSSRWFKRPIFDKVFKEIYPKYYSGKDTNFWKADGRTADSIPTRIVRAMGYDGITPDKQTDNTSYGGVIYDIKPGTIKLIS